MGAELIDNRRNIGTIQDGTIFNPVPFPTATKDTYLDEGAPQFLHKITG